MQHFTCDACGKQLGEQRYVAKLEVYPAFNPDELTDADLDLDHLQEVAEIIEQTDPLEMMLDEQTTTQQFKFDLCAVCHHRYLQDPLGKQSRTPLHFSEN